MNTFLNLPNLYPVNKAIKEFSNVLLRRLPNHYIEDCTIRGTDEGVQINCLVGDIEGRMSILRFMYRSGKIEIYSNVPKSPSRALSEEFLEKFRDLARELGKWGPVSSVAFEPYKLEPKVLVKRESNGEYELSYKKVVFFEE